MISKLRKKIRATKERAGILGEFLGFLWKVKLWWMIPLFVMLVLVSVLLFFVESSSVAPFMYALI